MRTCARCGHQNPADASACGSCQGLLTLQLHSGAVPHPHLPTIPQLDETPDKSPGAGRMSVGDRADEPQRQLLKNTLTSISLKTAEYSPEELSFVESLSASGLFEEASMSTIDLRMSKEPGVRQEGAKDEHLSVSDDELSAAIARDKASEEEKQDVGFSLAGASFHDSQPLDIAEQLQAHALRDPLLGQQVGNFRFVEKIGRGGFGAVYRAEQVYLGEAAAIKVLHLHQVDNPETVRRFQREARALAQLRHNNIVKMIDFGMLPQYGFYLVMELLSGDNVYNRLRAREPFPLDRLKEIFRQLCDVLFFVHEKGIVHRDLKLSNIFLTPLDDGSEKLTLLDFGIAAIADDIDPITKTGAYIGTATYASPEQIQGTKELDGRSDLYSLGVLLYRLLVGKPPFEGRNAMDITHRKLATIAPLLSERAPDRTWAPELEAMMSAVLAREPDDRPANARAFWELCGPAFDAQAALWRTMTQVDETAVSINANDLPLLAQLNLPESGSASQDGVLNAAQQSTGNASGISLADDPAMIDAHTLEMKEDALDHILHGSRNDKSIDGVDRAGNIDIGAVAVLSGETLDEASQADGNQSSAQRVLLAEHDELDSLATLKQAGLDASGMLPGAMTLETPSLGVLSELKEKENEAAAGDIPPSSPYAAPSSSESESAFSDSGEAKALDGSTIPMRALYLEEDSGRDTIANPIDLDELPVVKEAIAALEAQEREEAASRGERADIPGVDVNVLELESGVGVAAVADGREAEAEERHLGDGPVFGAHEIYNADTGSISGRTKKDTLTQEAMAAKSRSLVWAWWSLGLGTIVLLGLVAYWLR